MSLWGKALLLASLLELPLIIMLIAGASAVSISPGLTGLIWYHIVPMFLLSFAWLSLFGHGQPSTGDICLWYALFAFAAFLIQVTVTAPLVFALVKAFQHVTLGSQRTTGK